MKGGILWAALSVWLVAASSVAADSATFTHDANGNLTSRTEGGVVWTYAYDSRDQLREVLRDGTIFEVYQYDAQGRRVRKTSADGVVRYVWDGSRIVQEMDDFGNTIATYEYAGDRLVSVDHVTEGTAFYVLDALGSPVGLVRADGTLAARYHLDAWGVLRAEEGESPNPFRFTGHQFDEATGLYYAKARYYDAGIGRFLTEDPAAGSGDSPRSLHRYLYAYSNPTVFHDPTGRTNALTAGINWMEATAEESLEANDETSTTAQLVKTSIAAGLLQAGADITSGLNWVVNSIALSTPLQDTKVGLEARAELEQARERARRAVASGVQIIQEDPGGGVLAALEAPDRIAVDALNKAARAASGDRQAQAELIAEGARAVPGLIPIGVAGRARQAERALGVLEDMPPGFRSRPGINPEEIAPARPSPLLQAFPEWRPGNSITQLTAEGKYPVWYSSLAAGKPGTIQGRYWMNRALMAEEGEFTARQAVKMRAGYAPQTRVLVRVRRTGETEVRTVSKELHHHLGNRGTPGFDEPLHIRELWPWQHASIDHNRRLDYDFVRFVED